MSLVRPATGLVRRVLHLSDLHFGTERAEVCSALLRLARQLQPDVVLLSGDLTQRATPAQFAAAQAFVAQLPLVPTLLLPGNHDIPLFDLWQRWARPYRRYAAAFGAATLPALVLPGVNIIAADTTRRWRHRHGTLSGGQIRSVAAQLRQAPAQAWRIVVTHHPLLVLDPHDAEDRPAGHARALQDWTGAGAQLLLAGHIHLPALLQVPQSPAPAWVVQAGTAVSHRTRPGVPNSVNLLVQQGAPGAWQRELQRFDYSAADKAFVIALREPL